MIARSRSDGGGDDGVDDGRIGHDGGGMDCGDDDAAEAPTDDERDEGEGGALCVGPLLRKTRGEWTVLHFELRDRTLRYGADSAAARRHGGVALPARCVLRNLAEKPHGLQAGYIYNYIYIYIYIYRAR